MNYRQRIDNRGLKISWLAKKIKVSQPLLSQFLRGNRTLKESKIKQLEKLLK